MAPNRYAFLKLWFKVCSFFIFNLDAYYRVNSGNTISQLAFKQVSLLSQAHCSNHSHTSVLCVALYCSPAAPDFTSISGAARNPRLADQGGLWHFWHSRGQGERVQVGSVSRGSTYSLADRQNHRLFYFCWM